MNDYSCKHIIRNTSMVLLVFFLTERKLEQELTCFGMERKAWMAFLGRAYNGLDSSRLP
jgi:hypothetical protein